MSKFTKRHQSSTKRQNTTPTSLTKRPESLTFCVTYFLRLDRSRRNTKRLQSSTFRQLCVWIHLDHPGSAELTQSYLQNVPNCRRFVYTVLGLFTKRLHLGTFRKQSHRDHPADSEMFQNVSNFRRFLSTAINLLTFCLQNGTKCQPLSGKWHISYKTSSYTDVFGFSKTNQNTNV